MQGLMSISISPAITTTPALDSVFPIYYENQMENAEYHLISEGPLSGDYAVTATPTPGWSVSIGDVEGTPGEAVTDTRTANHDALDIVIYAVEGTFDDATEDTAYIEVSIAITPIHSTT